MGLSTARTIEQVLSVVGAVRADGDNTAVFWVSLDGQPDHVLRMQRLGPSAELIDEHPIDLLTIPTTGPTARGQIAVAWDHDACEPTVLVGEDSGAATLHVGGVRGPSVAHPIILHDSETGVDLSGAVGLSAVEGGWTLLSADPHDLFGLAQVFITAQGVVRSTQRLTSSAPVDLRGLWSVTLLDQSVLLLQPDGESTSARDYRRFDPQGQLTGAVETWRGDGTPFAVAPTATGALFARQASSSSLAVAALDGGSVTPGPAHIVAFPSTHRPRGLVATHGRTFAVVADPTSPRGRVYLQPISPLGTTGAPMYLDDSADGSADGFQMVPTSLGGLLVYTTSRGITGFSLAVAPLRLCD